MRIIISPAKKLNIDTNSLDWTGLPQFLPEAEVIKNCLQKKTFKNLQVLWKCNDLIAAVNVERLQCMDLKKNLTPAILAYKGIQYQYMAPNVFEIGHIDYIREHLRILSGFYGMLQPFDGIVPYRLEMQAKLAVGGSKDLYTYWGNKLAKQLCAEINLASREYSKAVTEYLPMAVRLVTCIFGARIDGRIIEKGTMCKMARGQMVRWLADRRY
jgi:cytoplasmic iron level regulating protein YaaA (DUF328/UPF0246 family)